MSAIRLAAVTIAAWRCRTNRLAAAKLRDAARGCESELAARELDRRAKIWQGRMMRWGSEVPR